MAKFLSTSGISHHLEEIIKGATRQLTLVSPYLRLNERIRQLIREKGEQRVEVLVLFGKEDLRADEETWLRSQSNVRLCFLKHLHAKCYLHESVALVTSMNLHEFSQVNNAEMGVLVSGAEDPGLFGEITQEVARLVRAAEREKPGEPPSVGRDRGWCIRCGTTIPLDPTRAYCKDCYATWQRYGNEGYVEKVCHVCGRPFASIRRKPACEDCYRREKGSLSFPAAGAMANAKRDGKSSVARKVGRLLRHLGKRITDSGRGR